MLKAAILGAGTIARKMAATLNGMDTVEAHAIAARDWKRTEAFAAEYGFQKAYGSYEELVSDKNVELVYIAVPHTLHYECAKLCLEHGKHVLCEKPFTVSSRQAKELFRLAETRRCR